MGMDNVLLYLGRDDNGGGEIILGHIIWMGLRCGAARTDYILSDNAWQFQNCQLWRPLFMMDHNAVVSKMKVGPVVAQP